jgi:phosphopantothenate-cysteine ligase/phosphopantothenoylcysteine decarboxylase/phosphopantothenate--cysteine ligase
MNLLVTAGNTLTPIDRVRCITNIFTGRTGAAIALEAHRRGHAVTLLTSHPEAVADLHPDADPLAERWAALRYRTFDDLQRDMARLIAGGGFDAVVHCAAVSDYLPAGVYAPAPQTRFHPEDGRWESDELLPPALADRTAGKVKSDEPELWLRLVRAPKLIDRIRTDWSFRGLLVKFKLEVGVDDALLLEVAERSRQHSAADLMVANTLEGAGHYAFLGPGPDGYERVGRRDLPARLLERLEQLQREGPHG